jgi:hypothetical protein
MINFSMTGTSPYRDLSVTYNVSDFATIPETHEQFQKILDLLLSGSATDEKVAELVDVFKGAAKRLTVLSERVSTRGRELLFDGDPIHGEIVETILDLVASGDADKLKSVVNFLEKVKTNPDIRTIDGLLKWINNKDLIIAEDGDFLAYKGCRGIGDQRTSKHSGKAFVNGEEITGFIPNPDGAVVSMPRSTVDDGGYNMCSTGLHVATHSFAKNFSSGDGDTVLVKINPRDVVSVPGDESFQKLRVCRYTVLHAVAGRLDDKIYVQPALEAPSEETLEEAKAAAEEVVADDEFYDAQAKLEDALGIDDSFYEDDEDTDEVYIEDDEDEESPKLEELASRPSPFEAPTVDEIKELLKPVYEYGSVEYYEAKEKGEEFEVAEKAPEKPQEPLRQPNGRFTKAGALYEAKAAQRDALGRFKKNS